MNSYFPFVTRFCYTTLLLLLLTLSVLAQNISNSFYNSEEYRKYCKISNGSFEINNNSNSPSTFDVYRWGYCGFKGETPPTVQCNDKLHFEAETITPFGNCYLNLVTRRDSSWEGINTRLTKKLDAGDTYYFSVFVCLSNNMKSHTMIDGKVTSNPIPFGRPVSLTIYGGKNPCERTEILNITPPVRSVNWKEYIVELQPKNDIKYLNIEATYDPLANSTYEGNVSIDHISNIYIKTKL